MAKIGRPVSWPAPKTPFASRLQGIFPSEGLAKIAQNYFGGISKETVSRYLSGDSEPTISQILRLCKHGQINPLYVIFGLGHYSDEVYGLDDPELLKPEPQGGLRITSTSVSAIPPPNARQREPVNFVLEAQGLPVVGKAAADETQGTRAGFFPPDPEAHFEQVTIPETTAAVEILGDSMSPVLLDGQYALLGPEYSGSYNQPKNYEIVVADVEVKDAEQAGSDTRWEGVYCKRIVDAGDVWMFLSINHTGTPFSVAKVNCRVWPVIGVWFAGKGEIPKED